LEQYYWIILDIDIILERIPPTLTLASNLFIVIPPPVPLPQEFLDIDVVLRRITGAGGLPPLSTPPTEGGNKNGTDLGGFIFGDERHKLLHELSLDPSYRLPDVPMRNTDLSFYSKYFLPLPPNNSIKAGGWFDMIQADSYPRSRTQQSSSSSASVGMSSI
jgi:hypothetical protein